MEEGNYHVNCNNGCCGGSCLGFIIFIFLIGMLLGSVPTPWGNIELDIFPPAIRIKK